MVTADDGFSVIVGIYTNTQPYTRLLYWLRLWMTDVASRNSLNCDSRWFPMIHNLLLPIVRRWCFVFTFVFNFLGFVVGQRRRTAILGASSSGFHRHSQGNLRLYRNRRTWKGSLLSFHYVRRRAHGSRIGRRGIKFHLEIVFRSRICHSLRVSVFLSATEYHSDADY